MQRRQFLTSATATVAAASIAGCSGILGGDGGGGSGPESAVEAYVDAYDDSDPDALEDALHPDSPEAQQIPSEQELEAVGMSLESSEVTEGPEDGQATVDVEIEVSFMGASETTTGQFDVREHEGEWKVYGSSSN